MREATRNTIATGALLLLAGCGGGGGGSPASIVDGTGQAGIDVPEGVCDSELYREIVGTYRGRVTYDDVLDDGTLSPYCIWNMTARVVVDQDIIGCGLELAVDAPVEQPVVLDSSESLPFQCMEARGLRDLLDPNDLVDPEDLPFISFPLDFRVRGNPAPASGPYFGDPDVLGSYVRLFDSSAALIDFLRFDGAGTVTLIRDGSTTVTRLTGELTKETE